MNELNSNDLSNSILAQIIEQMKAEQGKDFSYCSTSSLSGQIEATESIQRSGYHLNLFETLCLQR